MIREGLFPDGADTVTGDDITVDCNLVRAEMGIYSCCIDTTFRLPYFEHGTSCLAQMSAEFDCCPNSFRVETTIRNSASQIA